MLKGPAAMMLVLLAQFPAVAEALAGEAERLSLYGLAALVGLLVAVAIGCIKALRAR